MSTPPTRRRRLPACLMGLWLCAAALGYAEDLARAPLSLHEAEHRALAHDPDLLPSRAGGAPVACSRPLSVSRAPSPVPSLCPR